MREMANRERETELRNNVAHRELGLKGRGLDQDAEQFGISSGQSQQRIDLDKAEQPDALDLPGWRFHRLKGDLIDYWSVSISGN